MARVAVFGGSFDPPHLGHVLATLWLLESGQVDRVLMIPVARHAFGKRPGADFAQRLAMCRVAVARLGDAVEVSDIEGRREGVSYMVDTLRQLIAERPQDSFRLVAGTDVAAEIGKWREGAEVLRLAPLIELPRPRAGERFDERPGALPPISSSHVRECLRAGRPVDFLISNPVREYIDRHQLYQETTS